jgi:transposase
LTALLRTIDLGVDARKALLHSQFKVIAGWRERREDSVVRTWRKDAIRSAKHIVAC